LQLPAKTSSFTNNSGQRNKLAEKKEAVTEPAVFNTASPSFRFGNIPLYQPPVYVQTKLAINTPGDEYEQEADAMADKVMRMADKDVLQTRLSSSAKIQRKCATCEEEEKIHRKEISNSVPAIGAAVHQTLQSSGQALEKATRSAMEPRFGFDFGKVKIHDDSTAHQSAKDINALAYTHGNHIAFAAGKYQPDTASGRRLIAHELTHVVQQSAAMEERSKNSKKLSPSCNFHLVQRAPESPEESVCIAETTEPVCERRPPLLGEPASITFKRTPYSRTQYTKEDRLMLEKELIKRQDLNATNGTDFIKECNKGFMKIWTTYVVHEMQEAAENTGWGLLAEVFGFAVREVIIAILAPYLKAALEGAYLLAELTEKAIAAGGEIAQSALKESRSASKLEERGHELEENAEPMADALNNAISPILDMMTHTHHYNDFLLQAPLSDLALFRIPIAIPRITSKQVESLVSRMIIRKLSEQKWAPYNREIFVVFKTDFANPGKPTVVIGPKFVGSEALGKPLIGHTVGELAEIPLNIALIESPKDRPYSAMLHRESTTYLNEDEMSEELGNLYGGLEIRREPGLPLLLSGPGGVGVLYHLFERVSPGVTLESLVRPLIENFGPKELQPMRRILSGSKYNGAELFIGQSVDSLRITGSSPNWRGTEDAIEKCVEVTNPAPQWCVGN
jgi:hypothetical protein